VAALTAAAMTVHMTH